MRSASMSVVLGVAIAVVGVAPRASATVGPAAGAGAQDERHRAEGNALMDEGDAHQAAGAHAEAARAYAKAFDAFARRAKADGKEKQAVSLAVDEFTAAQAREPGSLELLEEEAALLERFVARVGDETAQVEERTRVKERIAEVKREQAEAEAERREREAAAKERERVEGEPVVDEPQAEAGVKDSEPVATDPRSRRKGVVLVASGVVGLVGGAALVGAGVWTLGAADERRDVRLAELEAALAAGQELDEAGIRDGVDQWHQRGRGLGLGFAVSGAVLAAAGIGLTVWGAVTLRRSGKGSSARASVLPMVGAEGGGVVVRVAF